MKPADFTYRNDGLFVAIMPETAAATEVWNTVIAPQTDSTGKVLAGHFPKVLADMRRKGYVVRKVKPVTESDEELLKGLS